MIVDYGSRPSSDPAENGSFTFSVAADADNFYITMVMPDQNIIAGKHGTDFWNEDSMEFYLNASGDLAASHFAPKIFQININAADIGNTDPAALTVTGVNSGDTAVRGYVFETADGWGFEASVPLADLLQPEHGLEIGFQAQINGASQQDRDVKLIWSKADTTDQSWNIPRIFGRGLFFELGQTDIPQPSMNAPQPSPTPAPTSQPAPVQISVNQTGYFPNGQKIASIAVDSGEEMAWELRDDSGEIVFSGMTTSWGLDSASGDTLHWIDFSEFDTPGTSYRIVAGDWTSAPFAISDKIYERLKGDALAYFYHARSGTPIEAKFVGDAWARRRAPDRQCRDLLQGRRPRWQ